MFLLMAVFKHLVSTPENQKACECIQMTGVPNVPYRLNLVPPYNMLFMAHFLDRENLDHILTDPASAGSNPVARLMADNVIAAVEVIRKITGDSNSKMFTTLNTPGLPLTAVEYLKAVVLGELKEKGKKLSGEGLREVKRKIRSWTNAEDTLGSREVRENFVTLQDVMNYAVNMTNRSF
ncbi:hypothetical protein HDV00_010745 [Rhizophlyctis rosea]|nr:hypothetical protein HDV00_010745 [Rhizophlyctis rosea]